MDVDVVVTCTCLYNSAYIWYVSGVMLSFVFLKEQMDQFLRAVLLLH